MLLLLSSFAIASPAVQAAPTTVQQDFQRATELAAAGQHVEALALWTAIEKRVVGNRRTRAIVAVRKSEVLFKMRRSDEAVAAARAGLADLPANDASLREDRYLALMNLGRVAEVALDYAGAAQSYAQAEAFADVPGTKLSALWRLALTDMFVDPASARAALDRADALMASNPVEKQITADFTRLRGLSLLNAGDPKAALRMSAKAIELLGGMTLKIDQRDMLARSDAAIAALLAGDEEEARRYMAYTGAGRLGKGVTFDPGTGITSPECGGEAGLKPADVAVVQFSIGDDGSVIDSAPVYAAGGGKVALEFARAARRWSWTPEQVKQLPPFSRYNVRLELRCSTGFERPSLRDILGDHLGEWLQTRGQARPARGDMPDAAAAATQRAALAAAEAKGAGAIQTLPPLYALMTNPVVGREETVTLGQRASAIAANSGAPPLARLAIDMVVAQSSPGEASSANALLARPVYAGDARARAAIRLAMSDRYKPGSSRAIAELRQIADDAALPANDPMKVGALVRLASAEQAAGRAADARAAFDRSGLSASQCALVDSPPKFLSSDVGFPTDAQRWGFEGWTQVQYDVSAAGKAAEVRVVASYPPFVFSKAGAELFARGKFSKSYRPDGSLGCGGMSSRIRFRIG